MYAWLWRRLPGGRAAKAIQCAVLAGVVIVILFAWVFPWADGFVEYAEPSLNLGEAYGR